MGQVWSIVNHSVIPLAFNPVRSGPGLWNHFYFLSSACSFCISTSLPMQFVQKRAHRSLRISIWMRGCHTGNLVPNGLCPEACLQLASIELLTYHYDTTCRRRILWGNSGNFEWVDIDILVCLTASVIVKKRIDNDPCFSFFSKYCIYVFLFRLRYLS